MRCMSDQIEVLPGLVSVTFRDLTPEEIIELARRARMKGIEWGGDVHVPHGKLKLATDVGAMTREAGMEVYAYGSYYRLQQSAKEGLAFSDVLETARKLQTSCIRVWAGTVDSEDADEEYWKACVDEARDLADQCANENMTLAFEFHSRTLTNTATSTKRLMKAIDLPNVRTFWQPIAKQSFSQNLENLQTVLPWLAHLHVFYWRGEPRQRLPLAEGESHWLNYLKLAWNGMPRYAAIEFVPDASPDKFIRDAGVLQRWLKIIQQTPAQPARG